MIHRDTDRCIPADLRRVTVSVRELASLGWLHGTLGRFMRALGLSWRWHEATPAFDSLGSGRIDTASLVIEPSWRRDLKRWGIIAGIALGLVIFLALVTPAAEPEAEAEADIPAVAIAEPEPSLLAIEPVPRTVAAAPQRKPATKANKAKTPRRNPRVKRQKKGTR